MQHTNNNSVVKDILDVNQLDLLTENEKKFNQTYVKKLQGYAEGKVEGIQIKNLTAGAATIAKRQQSRSAVALLRWNMINRPPNQLPDDNDPEKSIGHN